MVPQSPVLQLNILLSIADGQFAEKPLILVCPMGRKDPMETSRTGMVLVMLTLSEYWSQRGPKTPASCLYSSQYSILYSKDY